MVLTRSYLAATKAPIIIENTVILIPQEKVFLQNKIKKCIHVPLVIHKDSFCNIGKKQTKNPRTFPLKSYNNHILNVSKELDISKNPSVEAKLIQKKYIHFFLILTFAIEFESLQIRISLSRKRSHTFVVKVAITGTLLKTYTEVSDPASPSSNSRYRSL